MSNSKIKFDKDRLVQYGEILERTLRDWEELGPKTTLKTLQEDRQKYLFLCYAMEASIQTALDVGNHLIARNGWERPGTYKEVFEIVSRHRLLAPKLAMDLQGLVGFRNVLVHRYPELKLNLVHRHLKKSHRPLRLFLQAIGKLLG